MKYLIVLGVAVIFSGLTTGDVQAQFGKNVVDTPHNLRKVVQGCMSNLNIRDYGDVCAYCHLSKELLMWNRKLPVTTYQLSESRKIAVGQATSPDSTSLFCLSCHDGTLALDALKQIPAGLAGGGGGEVTIASCTSGCHTKQNPGGGIIFGEINFGSDVQKHHPIGIIYNISKNANLHAPLNGKVGDLPLYGPDFTQIGCATCHDPHDDSQRPFLRKSNNNSELCLTCHDM